MKRVFVVLAFALLFIAAGQAREENTFEPEYYSVFYYLPPSGPPIELERQTPNMATKGIHTLYVISGEKSPVRLAVGSKMRFIVRVVDPFDKARATLQLFRLESKDGMRQIQTTRLRIFANAGLKFSTQKYGDSSLELMPSRELAAGEYCLSRSTIAQGFCFGVDPTGVH